MQYYIGHPSPRHFYICTRPSPQSHWKIALKHAHIMQEVAAYVNANLIGYEQVSDPYGTTALSHGDPQQR